MITYLIRRLLLIIPTLFGVTVVVFFALAMQPGGIGGALLADTGNAKGAEAARIREYYIKRYRLDKPAYVQYGRWLNLISPIGFEIDENTGDLGAFGFKKPGLGTSNAGEHRGTPVTELLSRSLPLTLILGLISTPFVYVIGITSGIRAARHRGKFFDVGFGTMQLAAWSLPTIWVGTMLVGFLANDRYVHWFPTAALTDPDLLNAPFFPFSDAAGWHRGWLLDACWHLVLPVVCLSYGSSAFLTKLVRGSVLENLSADYARTARAKGLPDRVVLYRHVFRNSLLALITIAAAILPALVTGSFIIETIFGIPGMGSLAVNAVRAGDNEVTLAVVCVTALLIMVSALIRDLMYAVADPRVAYD